MSTKELAEECQKFGLPKSGSRADLMERLNGPRPPALWVERKRKNQYVPVRHNVAATALLVAMHLHVQKAGPENPGMTKDEVCKMAESLHSTMNSPFSHCCIAFVLSPENDADWPLPLRRVIVHRKIIGRRSSAHLEINETIQIDPKWPSCWCSLGCSDSRLVSCTWQLSLLRSRLCGVILHFTISFVAYCILPHLRIFHKRSMPSRPGVLLTRQSEWRVAIGPYQRMVHHPMQVTKWVLYLTEEHWGETEWEMEFWHRHQRQPRNNHGLEILPSLSSGRHRQTCSNHRWFRWSPRRFRESS